MPNTTATSTPAMHAPPANANEPSSLQEFISRNNLAKRWDKSPEFLKSKERTGELRPVRLGYRSIVYRFRDVVELEEKMTG